MRLSPFLPLRLQLLAFRFVVRQLSRGLVIGKAGFFALLLRNYVKRPEWLLYPGVATPKGDLVYSPADNLSNAESGICTRLLAAYRSATRDTSTMDTVGGPWKGIIAKRYRGFIEILEQGSAEDLQRQLSTMFRQPFLYGISSADVGTDPHFAPFLKLKLQEEVLALAEVCGIVRAETPEQGVLGHGFQTPAKQMAEGIETTLGIDIGFPRISGAYGVDLASRLITPESPEHIYVGSRIREVTAKFLADEPLRIVEIGAGFGGTAYWLMKLLATRRPEIYTIIDLPMMNVCQAYFLAHAFGADSVALHGEALTPNTLFHILPPHAIRAKTDTFNLLINENSMPEMPRAVVRDYLAWAKQNLNGIFYSYNQEAYSPVDGVEQTLVPNVVHSVGGFSRVSRNQSWLRRGYVEEVYLLKGSSCKKTLTT